MSRTDKAPNTDRSHGGPGSSHESDKKPGKNAHDTDHSGARRGGEQRDNMGTNEPDSKTY
ncbi:MAG TPA: hypothetical protein VEH84_16690 [Alphaproteobacteria bacterium]|nr:hypothetical protein [Alphaproteobacteria bacterium]